MGTQSTNKPYSDRSILLIYDGKCPFCKHFAEISELRSGIPQLSIKDGRKELEILSELSSEGYSLSNGAILIVDKEILHGEKAIAFLCNLMNPSDNLLRLIVKIFSNSLLSNYIYSLVLIARRAVLLITNVSLDPLKDCL